MSTQSAIYVIGPEGGPYKVGVSQDPRSRLHTLQTGRTDQLLLLYEQYTSTDKAVVLEKLIHRQMAHLRLRGEWFAAPLDHVVSEVSYAFIRWEGEDNLAFRFKRGLL